MVVVVAVFGRWENADPKAGASESLLKINLPL